MCTNILYICPRMLFSSWELELSKKKRLFFAPIPSNGIMIGFKNTKKSKSLKKWFPIKCKSINKTFHAKMEKAPTLPASAMRLYARVWIKLCQSGSLSFVRSFGGGLSLSTLPQNGNTLKGAAGSRLEESVLIKSLAAVRLKNWSNNKFLAKYYFTRRRGCLRKSNPPQPIARLKRIPLLVFDFHPTHIRGISHPRQIRLSLSCVPYSILILWSLGNNIFFCCACPFLLSHT